MNGAGLAMATMDVTTKSGCFPANFLDVGGSTDKEKIKEAFRILVSDKNVKFLLVNLFAGIARADLIAEGIVEAAKEASFNLPIIVSMRGTNSEKGFSANNLFIVLKAISIASLASPPDSNTSGKALFSL